ncbi:FMN-linked oxidoreductase [Pseudohyphozyma bogoriensis]|nr:FMN-linked oxidoreductase [Pseudohyphozyma bogoriensis]
MSYATLQEPIAIGALPLKNRTVMSSLTRNRATDKAVPTDLMIEYYTQRAQGGVGLIMSEGTIVSPQGVEWTNVPGLWSKEQVKQWKKITDAVHANGSLIVAQLWHVGRVAHPDLPLQKAFGPVSAPSPVSARGGWFRTLKSGYVAPEHEVADPSVLVEEFRQAAINAKEAGFDGVELHGANGYLIAQFLDPMSNVRTDKWGGSLENRARFLFDVMDAVLSVWPADRVGVKLNPIGGYNDMGVNDEETVKDFSYVINGYIPSHSLYKFFPDALTCGSAVERRLAYIQLVRWTGEEFFNPKYDGKFRVNTKLDVLDTFGPLVVNSSSHTKLLLNGEISGPEAEKLVESGKVDAVVFGRPFINNPDFIHRLFTGLPMNEDLGLPNNPHTFYHGDNDDSEGYTNYPAAALPN